MSTAANTCLAPTLKSHFPASRQNNDNFDTKNINFGTIIYLKKLRRAPKRKSLVITVCETRNKNYNQNG